MDRQWYYCKRCDYEFVRPDRLKPNDKCPICGNECKEINISTWEEKK